MRQTFSPILGIFFAPSCIVLFFVSGVFLFNTVNSIHAGPVIRKLFADMKILWSIIFFAINALAPVGVAALLKCPHPLMQNHVISPVRADHQFCCCVVVNLCAFWKGFSQNLFSPVNMGKHWAAIYDNLGVVHEPILLSGWFVNQRRLGGANSLPPCFLIIT